MLLPCTARGEPRLGVSKSAPTCDRAGAVASSTTARRASVHVVMYMYAVASAAVLTALSEKKIGSPRRASEHGGGGVRCGAQASGSQKV